jgi:hypothetical protein
MKQPSKHRGGGSSTRRANNHQAPSGCGKNFGQNSLVPGAPEIAHPGDRERYERQIAFITAWIFEMGERMRIDDDKPSQPGQEARAELQSLLLNTIGQVLRVARGSKDGVAKKWAGELLAIIGVSTDKHDKYDKKLKANAAYAEMKKKLNGKSLTSALFPTYVCGIAQQELEKAMTYRKRLLLRKGWPPALTAEKRKIPKAYWLTMNLPEFSMQTEPQWWEFLCPLIGKKVDLSKMPPLKRREYNTERWSYSSRTGKVEVREGEKKIRTRYRSDIETTAHDHLKLLARLRDAGIFY